MNSNALLGCCYFQFKIDGFIPVFICTSNTGHLAPTL